APRARRGAVAVGRRPYGAVADSTHLYVSDWGDSTVSVVDPSVSPPVRLTAIHVGPHPSALALRGADLYVALAGANAVARVDLRSGTVVEQLAVTLSPRAATGSDPNALALSPDGRTLYVAMAGNNAVAVVRIGRTGMRVAGLVPVGWYPTAVATSADGRTLFVANGKGNGSGANRDGTYIGNVISGSVSIVPVPDDATLARYTRDVYALSPYSNARIRPTVRASDRPTQVKHVVYIIRENRTYDQVLGDVRGANGDPELAIFNDSITPNAHAIAHRWVLFDNFYVNGEVSADGHEWSDRAFAGDYNETTWPQIYGHAAPTSCSCGCRGTTPTVAPLGSRPRARWWPTTTSRSGRSSSASRCRPPGPRSRCSCWKTTRRTDRITWMRTARYCSSPRRTRRAAWWTARSTRPAPCCAPSGSCSACRRSASTIPPQRRCGTPSRDAWTRRRSQPCRTPGRSTR